MNVVVALLPALSVLFLALVAVLPWGLPEGMQFFMPLLPVMAIFYWIVNQPRFVPVVVVFATGLSMDVLTHGPLGLWSLVYLIAVGLGYVSRDLRLTETGLLQWAAFVGCLAALTVIEWLVSSLYFGRLIDLLPLAKAAGWAALCYPVVALALWPINRIWSQRTLGR